MNEEINKQLVVLQKNIEQLIQENQDIKKQNHFLLEQNQKTNSQIDNTKDELEKKQIINTLYNLLAENRTKEEIKIVLKNYMDTINKCIEILQTYSSENGKKSKNRNIQ